MWSGSFKYLKCTLSPLLRWQLHPIHNLSLLRITDARRVQPVGQLIGRACRVMSHKGGCEVLRGACALTLGDEPLAGGVEHSAMQFWMTPAQVSVSLYDPIHAEVREQPSGGR